MFCLAVISIIRYLINGLFSVFMFKNSESTIFVRNVIFSIIYTTSLSCFKFFINDSPIITFVSTIILAVCLAFGNKFKIDRIILTYSIFVNCILECIHFLIFGVVSLAIAALRIPEITRHQPERLLVGRAVVLALYIISILVVYKFFKIGIISICRLTDYKIFSIFLSLVLCVIIYLKYCIKCTYLNQIHNILSLVFIFFIILSLIFIFSSKAFLEKIDNFKKSKLNPAIEEAKLQKGKGYAGMKFVSKKLNSEMYYFQKELENIGMDTEDKKSKQISFCAVLLSHEENPRNANMRPMIYSCLGEILDRQPKSIESNIGNALQNHWSSFSSQKLKKIEQNYHGPISTEHGAPTPKEFLLYLVEKYKKEHPMYENNCKNKYLFFKKYFLHL